VFDNRALRRIFGSKRDEGIGCFRKLNNEELYSLYSSPNIIGMIKSRSMSCGGHVACMEEERSAQNILVRKPERKRPLGRPKHTWENNMKINFKEVGWKCCELN
jgi:hypothetical protein